MPFLSHFLFIFLKFFINFGILFIDIHRQIFALLRIKSLVPVQHYSIISIESMKILTLKLSSRIHSIYYPCITSNIIHQLLSFYSRASISSFLSLTVILARADLPVFCSFNLKSPSSCFSTFDSIKIVQEDRLMSSTFGFHSNEYAQS